MALLRGIFWIALFIFFTFCFVVLFEYGTHDFTNGFQKEFSRVKTFVLKFTRRILFRLKCRCNRQIAHHQEICGWPRGPSRRSPG